MKVVEVKLVSQDRKECSEEDSHRSLKEPRGALCTPQDSASKEPAETGVCVLVLAREAGKTKEEECQLNQ